MLKSHSNQTSGMHHQECVVPNIDISRVDDSEPRLSSCWIVFIAVLDGILVVSYCSPKGQLLRSGICFVWHGHFERLCVSPHHSAHGGTD